MTFHRAHTTGQQAGSHRLQITDLLRIMQLERQMKNALDELEQVKGRLNRLEKEIAVQSPDGVFTEKTQIPQQAETTQVVPPLPIAEIKQLAEMAKRFR